jgi:lipopolysaccharide/colanic/teichoic acid biosynthesis glycosyltransferase
MLDRIIAVTVSLFLIALTAPVFLLTALAIWCTDRGPVFYLQTRAGRDGQLFRMMKFRSMRVNDLPVNLVGEAGHEHPLVTPVGRWIRRLKIDELPQLINVLKGEMALVGPRPTVPEQVKSYTPFQRLRLKVLPGMTGWAQVNGGAEISWPERIILEVWYVDHCSVWLDLTIIFRTFAVVVGGHRPNLAALQQAFAYACRQTSLDQMRLVPEMEYAANDRAQPA